MVKSIYHAYYIIETVMFLSKKKIYKNRQKGNVANIAEMNIELSVQLQYEQNYAETERKLLIFDQKRSDLIYILG